MLDVAVLGLGACTTYRGLLANPVERLPTWFSYLTGGAMRAACKVGEPDHYRFVYNGIYEVQICVY